MKTRILHISHTDIRFDSRILKEMESLSTVPNYEIIGFGIDDSNGTIYTQNFDADIKFYRLWSKRLKFLAKPIKFSLIYIEAMFRLIIPAIKLKPQVVHCHDTLFLPIAVIIKLFCGSKLVYDAHELESQKNAQSKILSKISLYIEKISWRFLDLLISVSPSILVWYNQNLGAKDNLLILNSPQFNPKVFEETSNNYLREKFKIPADEKIFIYLGIIGRGRGVDLYLETFQSPDINSHIVFIGFGEYVPKVEQISQQAAKVHYHPPVLHQDVVKISKSADVGLAMIEAVSLSDYYCLPNKLFEYAFSGLFVMASDFPDMKKVVEEYDLGLCCSLEIEDIKNAVKKIEEMELPKRTVDLKHLSWQYQSEKLLEAYGKLLIIKN